MEILYWHYFNVFRRYYKWHIHTQHMHAIGPVKEWQNQTVAFVQMSTDCYPNLLDLNQFYSMPACIKNQTFKVMGYLNMWRFKPKHIRPQPGQPINWMLNFGDSSPCRIYSSNSYHSTNVLIHRLIGIQTQIGWSQPQNIPKLVITLVQTWTQMGHSHTIQCISK